MRGLMWIAFLAVWVIARACGVPDFPAVFIGAFCAVGITCVAESVRTKTFPRDYKNGS